MSSVHRDSHLLKILADTNIFIAAVAALSVQNAGILFHEFPDWKLSVIVGSATFLTYNSQRFIAGNKAIAEIKPVMKWAMILSILMVIGLSPFLSVAQILILFVAGLLSLFYVVPILPYRSNRLSFREFPYLKIWVITAVWILVICVLPLLNFSNQSSSEFDLALIIFILHQACFILALTIPFDIRDLKDDSDYQKTLPMVFGVENSVSAARSLIWISFFLFGMNFLFGFYDLDVVIFQLLLVMYTLPLISQSKERQEDSFYTIKIDGIIGLQAILIFLSYFIKDSF